METFSALLAICAGNSPVTGEFPTQRPVTRSFDVSFDLRPNEWLSKQSWGWWFETPTSPLWRHRNVLRLVQLTLSRHFNIHNKQHSTWGETSLSNLPRQWLLWGQNLGWFLTWRCNQMETFSEFLAFCVENSPVTGEFPSQRPVTWSFDVFFDLHLNKQSSKQWLGWWFETPSCPLWRNCNYSPKVFSNSHHCVKFNNDNVIFISQSVTLTGILAWSKY